MPAGEYAVTVIWPGYYSGGDEEVEGPDRLKGKYNRVESPLARVVVEKGPTELRPFELTIP